MTRRYQTECYLATRLDAPELYITLRQNQTKHYLATVQNNTNPWRQYKSERYETLRTLATNPNFTRLDLATLPNRTLRYKPLATKRGRTELTLATKRKKLTINPKETTMSAPTTVPAIYQGNHLNCMKQALINAHLMKDDGSIERAIRVTAATQKAFMSMLSLIGGEGETSEERDALRSALKSPITRATIEERKFFFLQE